MADGGPVLLATRNGKLGAAELGRGNVTVSLDAGALVLVGANGVRFVLPFRSIGRLRLSRLRDAGRNPSRLRFYRLAVWKDVEGPSMILWPDCKQIDVFHGLLRELAEGVWAGGSGSVERGVSWAAAARSSLWLFLAMTVAYYVADRELSWNLSQLALVEAIGGFALISILTTRFDQDRPRTIDDAQELERVFKA